MMKLYQNIFFRIFSQFIKDFETLILTQKILRKNSKFKILHYSYEISNEIWVSDYNYNLGLSFSHIISETFTFFPRVFGWNFNFLEIFCNFFLSLMKIWNYVLHFFSFEQKYSENQYFEWTNR